MTAGPTLSVVVALISGRADDLRRCLTALHAQTMKMPLEVIVPYDPPCADVVRLQAEFPAVRFLPVELDTRAARAGASREHHDTLRTIGLRAASGEVVALTEDHAHVAANWCEEMAAALARHSAAAAVGGAVECDSARLLNWAVWFCDFGRYQNPLPEAAATFVSDSNVAYRRSAIQTIEATWQHDYHETAVHEALVKAGFELRTTPRVVVWQARGELSWGNALRERYVWARSFAGSRARLIGARRLLLAVLSPVLPVLMTWRLIGLTRRRARHTRRLIGALPHVFLLQCVWAVGEAVGYVTADPG
jgi:GT2 family glycosyltransferase